MSNENMVQVLLHVNGNQGYAADQVERTITLGELIYALQEAAEQYGEDAYVVTHDGGNRYGANFGGISPWGDVVTGVEDEDEW